MQRAERVTGITTGSVTINYTVTNAAGCSQTVSAPVVINAAPAVAAITGTSNECAGSMTILSDGTIGGAWSSGNTAIATVDVAGNVTGIAPGTTIIFYSIPGGSGCPGLAATIDTVNAIPVESPLTGVLHVCPAQAQHCLTASLAAHGAAHYNNSSG